MRSPLFVVLLAGLAIAPSPARGVGDTPPDVVTPGPLLAGVPTWEELAPPTRAWAATAHDTRRNRLLVIGGMSDALGSLSPSVWALELTAARWQRIRPTGSEPAPRWGASAVYDSLHDRVVLYGGEVPTSGGSAWGAWPSDEMWVLELSGTPGWRQIPRSGAWPAGRSFAGFAADGVGANAWLYAGRVWPRPDATPDTATLWRLDLNSLAWTRAEAVGPWPLDRQAHGMVWVPELAAFVVHGGRARTGEPLADTWTLTAGAVPTWTPSPSLTAPDPAADFSFVHRSANGDVMRVSATTPGVWSYSTLSLPSLDWDSTLEPYVAPAPRLGAWAADLGEAGVAYGGGLREGVTQADAWRIPSRAGEVGDLIVAAPEFDYRNPPFLALDPVRGSHVHLGALSRLWRYDASRRAWTRGPYVSSAPNAQSARVVLDAPRDRLLLLGGGPWGGYEPMDPPFRDVRALSLAEPFAWTIALPSDPTTPVFFDPPVIADPSRDRWYVIAGRGASESATWALELSPTMRWARVPSRGVGPTWAWGAEATWDRATASVVLVASDDATRTVAWTTALTDTLEWIALATLGGGPPPLKRFALTMDTAQRRALLHGGFSGLGDENPAEVRELSRAGTPTWNVGTGAGDAPPRGAATFAEWPGDPFARLELANNRVFRVSWTLPSPVDARGESLLVGPTASRVVWSGAASAGLVAFVECTDAATPSVWRRLGTTVSGEDRRWRYVDDGPRPAPMAYRLVFERETGPVAAGTIGLGRAPAFGALRVGCASANPGPALDRVELTLPARAAVSLSLVDVTGRRVWSRTLPELDAGVHVLGVAAPERPRPGLYWLVAEAGARRASTRVAIVR